MRDEVEHRRHVVPSSSRGAQRRRRLARGVARWDFDRLQCAEPTRRVATITLTVDVQDAEAARGWIRTFWRRVRQVELGTRYFAWLELQRSGRIHYHCIWLNPPHRKKRDLVHDVARWWGHGRTQVRFTAARDGLERELDYVIGYTKKMGRKSYQQRYDQVPRELRTFMSQRLEIPPKVVDEHLDQDLYVYRGDELRTGWRELGGEGPSSSTTKVWSTEYKPAVLEYVGRRIHVVPIGGYCSANDYRRVRTKGKPPTKLGASMSGVAPLA